MLWKFQSPAWAVAPRFRGLCAAAFFLACSGVAGAADRVMLNDGSQIVGQVISQNEQSVTVETEFAGTLTIPAEKVAQVLAGEAPEAPAPPPPPPPPPPAPPKKEWTARVEAGLDGKTGNTERVAFHGRAEANQDLGDERLKLYFGGAYSKENGVRSTNEIIGGALKEWDLTDRLFAFGRLELEYDEFENLDLRATVTGGLGYFLIREDDQELKVRGGIGYQHQKFDDGSKTDDVIGELGVDYRKEITPWLLFTHSTTWYPTIDDPIEDWRGVSETAGEIPLADNAWKLRLGVRFEYDNEPEDDVERLDTTYFANLVWEWK